MPELPEVETTKRGLKTHIVGKQVLSVGIHQKQLRWEIPSHLPTTIKGEFIKKISRRAKYILIKFSNGTLVMHLGMSGSISVVPSEEVLKKHHHFELVLDNATSMRFHDPRRFGSILWQKNNELLSLFNNLGPEPLTSEFNDNTLYQSSRGKKKNIKTFIMDSNIAVSYTHLTLPTKRIV